jgi:hypothetical protein
MYINWILCALLLHLLFFNHESHDGRFSEASVKKVVIKIHVPPHCLHLPPKVCVQTSVLAKNPIFQCLFLQEDICISKLGRGTTPKPNIFVFMIENPIFSTVSRPSTKQKDLQEPNDRS